MVGEAKLIASGRYLGILLQAAVRQALTALCSIQDNGTIWSVGVAHGSTLLCGQRRAVCAASLVSVSPHNCGDAVGQRLKEQQVALGELARLGAPDLKHPEHLLAVSGNRHADQPTDAMSDRSVQHAKPAPCCETAEVDGLAGMPGEACRGAQVCRDPCPPNKAGLHADPGRQHERLFVRTILPHPGKPGADAFSRAPAGFLEDQTQVARSMRQFVEPCERRPLL